MDVEAEEDASSDTEAPTPNDETVALNGKHHVTIKKFLDKDHKQSESSAPFKSVSYTITKSADETQKVSGGEIPYNRTEVDLASDETLTILVDVEEGYDASAYKYWKEQGRNLYVKDENSNENGEKTDKFYKYVINVSDIGNNTDIKLVAKKLVSFKIALDEATKEHIESVHSYGSYGYNNEFGSKFDTIFTDGNESVKSWVDASGAWTQTKDSLEKIHKYSDDANNLDYGYFFYAIPEDGYEIAVSPENPGNIISERKDGKYYFQIRVMDTDKNNYIITAKEKSPCTLTIPDSSALTEAGIEKVQWTDTLDEANVTAAKWNDFSASKASSAKSKIYLKVTPAAGYDMPKIYPTYGGKEDAAPVTVTGTAPDQYYALDLKDNLSLRFEPVLSEYTITITKDPNVKTVYYTKDNGKKVKVEFDPNGTIEKVTCKNTVLLEMEMEGASRVTLTETPDGEAASEPKEPEYNTYSKRYEYELKDIKANVAVALTSEALSSVTMPDAKDLANVSEIKYATRKMGAGTALRWIPAVVGEIISYPSVNDFYLQIIPKKGYQCSLGYVSGEGEGATTIPIEKESGTNYYKLSAAANGNKLTIAYEALTDTKELTINLNVDKSIKNALRDLAYSTTDASDEDSWVTLGTAKEEQTIQNLAKDSVVYFRANVKPGYDCVIAKTTPSETITPVNGVYAITMSDDAAITVTVTETAQTVKYSKNLGTEADGTAITEANVFEGGSIKLTRRDKDGKTEELEDSAIAADGTITPAPGKEITCNDTLTLSFTPKAGYKVTVTKKVTEKKEEHIYYAGDKCDYQITNITAETTITVEAEKLQTLTIKGGEQIKEVRYAVTSASLAEAPAEEVMIKELPSGLEWQTAETIGNIRIVNIGKDEKVYLLALPEEHYTAAGSYQEGDPAKEKPLPVKFYEETGKTYTYFEKIDPAIGEVTLKAEPKKYTVTVEKDASVKNVAVTYTDDKDTPITPDTPGIAGKDSFSLTNTDTLKMSFSLAESYQPLVTVAGKEQTGSSEQDTGVLGNLQYTYEIKNFTADTQIKIEAKRASYKINSFLLPRALDGLGQEAVAGVTVKRGNVAVLNGKDFSISAGSDLVFTVEGVDEKHRPEVSYRTKVAVSPAAPAPDAYKAEFRRKETVDGKDAYTYRITAKMIEEIKDDVTIVVEVRKKDEQATVKADTGITHVKAVLGEKDGKYTVDLTSDSAELAEDAAYSFKVTADTYFKVKTVTVKNAAGADNDSLKVSGTGQNAVYSFTVGAGENIIHVTTEEDPEQMNRLKLNLVGDAESVTFALATEGADDDLEIRKNGMPVAFSADGSLATLNKVVVVTITPKDKDRYELALDQDRKPKVSVSGPDGAKVTATFNEETGAAECRVTLVSKKTVTLRVETKVKALENAKKVSFVQDEKVSHVTSLRVDSQENSDGESLVVREKGTESTYTMKPGVEKLRFTLNTTVPYAPAVTYFGRTLKHEGKPVWNEDGTRTWQYAIVAGELSDNDAEIKIEETEEKRKLTLEYDPNRMDVTVKDGTKQIYPTTEPPAGGEISALPEGTTLTVLVEAKEGFGITNIETKKDGAQEPFTDALQGVESYRFRLDLLENTTVTIDAGEIVHSVKVEDVNGIEMKKNVVGEYDLSCGEKYRISASVGKSGTVTFTEAKLFRDQEELEGPSDDMKDESALWRCSIKNTAKGETRPLFIFSDRLKKGKYTLALTRKGAEEEPLICYLNLYQPIEDKKVKIGNGGDIVQAADTTQSYPVTVNKGASADNILVAVREKDPNESTGKDIDWKEESAAKVITKQPEIRDGRLEITTGRVVNESYWLLFYTKKPNAELANGKVDEEDRIYLKKKDKFFTVKVTAGHLFQENVKPTVKLESASDIDLTLTLGAKNIAVPNETRVFYEVILTAEPPVAGVQRTVVKYVEKVGDSQTVTIPVADEGIEKGDGKVCKFGVSARLIHANLTKEEKLEDHLTGRTENNAGIIGDDKVLASGSVFSKVGFASTRKPAYETKLSLKAIKSTIYTGQTANVIKPVFGKDTSYNELESVCDVTPGLSDDAARLEVEIDRETNQIRATAGEGVALGKHTIRVFAVTGHDDMYAARGEINITVVRGIEEIKVNVSSEEICKTANKASTVKAVAAYNDNCTDEKTRAPKTPKVRWLVVGGDTEDEDVENAIEALRGLAKAKTFKGGIVTIEKDGVREETKGLIKIAQNGTVTVDKYEQAGKNFKILALANDYADNKTFALSNKIEITDKPVVLDEVRIMKAVEKDGSGEATVYREIKGTNSGAIEAKDLDGAVLMGFLTGMKEDTDGGYTAERVNKYAVEDGLLTYYSSNPRAVRVDTYSGKITVLKTAKNVKLSARTGDGGNKGKNTERSVTVTVSYDKTGDLSLEIEKEVNRGERKISWKAKDTDSQGPGYTKEIHFNDSTAAVFRLQVKQKSENEASGWGDITSYTNYNLSVSGGKLFDWNKKEGTASVQVNTGKAVVKLTNNETNPKITKKIVLINDAFENAKKVKAPKVSFTGKNKNVIGAESGARTIAITLKENGKNYGLDLYRGRKGEEELYVRVELDRTNQTTGNQAALNAFEESLQNKTLESMVNATANMELRFAEKSILKAGNYKLKITLGTVNEVREFIPQAMPAVVTVSVKKEPKLSFRPTTTYKMSPLDRTEIELTGKKASKDMIVEYLELKNAGKKSHMGEMNDFRKYFELDPENGRLKLTKECFRETESGGFVLDIPEEDRVGYVEYKGYYPYTQDENSCLYGAAKITIKPVDGKTADYTAKSTRVDISKKDVAHITILRGKQTVPVSYAAVEPPKKDTGIGTWSVGRYQDSEWEDTAIVTDSNPVVVGYRGGAGKIKTAKITLRVIPSDSHYVEQIEQLRENPDKVKDFVISHGVPVKVSIPLSDFNTRKGRIEFAYKNINYQDQTKSLYDAQTGEYYVIVPYKAVYADKLVPKKMTAKVVGGKFYEKGVGVSIWTASNIDANSGHLRISLKKSEIVKNPPDKKVPKWFYTTQGKAPTQWKKPNTFPVKIEVGYGSVKDEFTFNLTMPNYPGYITQASGENEVNTDFDQAVEKLRKNADAIGAAAARRVEKFDYPNIQNQAGKWSDSRLRDAIENAVKKELKYVLKNGGYSDGYGKVSGMSYDCGIDFDALKMEVGDGEHDYRAPIGIGSGGVNLEVTFKNNWDPEKGNPDYVREQKVNFTVRLKPLQAVSVTEMEKYVKAFLGDYNKEEKIWDVNAEAVREGLYTYLRDVKKLDRNDISNYRFVITVADPKAEENGDAAKAAEAASKKEKVVTIVIENVTAKGADETRTVGGNVPVGEKPTVEETIKNVKAALGIDPKDDDKVKKLAASNVKPGVEKAILAAAEGAIDRKLYEIDFAKKANGENDIDFAPLAKEKDETITPGSLSFTLVLTQDGKEITDDVSRGRISLASTEISGKKLLDLDEAERAVETWKEDNTLKPGENAKSSQKVLKGDTNAERILSAIRKDIVPEDSGVAVAFYTKRSASGDLVSDLKVKKATVREDGSVRGVLKLSAMDEEGKEEVRTVVIDVIIPMLSQDVDDACKVIETAFQEDAVIIPAGTPNGDAAVTETILDTARSLKGLKEDTFDVEVADDGELTIDGENATITLYVWKIKSGYGSGKPVEVTLSVEQSK